VTVQRRRSAFAIPENEPVFDPHEAAASTVREVMEERGAERKNLSTTALTLRAYADLVPEQRGPLDFERFPWQREGYDDHAAYDREQVWQKATQIGVSTLMIRWALFHADVEQRVGLYTFPTTDELGDFSRHRIRPVIRASAHLLSRMRGDAVNNVGQKEIGPGGWLYFRGTNKPIDSIPADVVVFDEYDTSDPDNIEASERRVTGPDSAGLIRRVGVPSIPGFGISALFEDSDQRVWTVKCRCKVWNPMRGFDAFQANVDQDAVALVCRKCRKPIDVLKGEWVATFPDRDVRGYHAPKLLIPGKRTLGLLIANSRKTKDFQRTAFFTRDLGEPFAPAEGRLSLEQVQACVRPELRLQESLTTHALVTMGVDVAGTRAFNVVIEEAVDKDRGRKVFVGEVDDEPGGMTAFQRLCWLMTSFGVNMAAIDNTPESRFSIAFAAKFPGRVYRVGFFMPGPQQKKDVAPWDVDDVERFVSLHRTMAYDATFERFRMQHVLLPPLDALPSDYATHLGNLYRQKTEVMRKAADGTKFGTGAVKVEYIKTGPEDWAQAEAYNLTAIELFWRNAGIQGALGQGPVPLAQLERDVYSADEDEVDYYPGGNEPRYSPGFE
jgi:hypothetical protein